jgi:hypothetical protein
MDPCDIVPLLVTSLVIDALVGVIVTVRLPDDVGGVLEDFERLSDDDGDIVTSPDKLPVAETVVLVDGIEGETSDDRVVVMEMRAEPLAFESLNGVPVRFADGLGVATRDLEGAL